MSATGDHTTDGDDPVARNRATHPRRHRDRDAVSTSFTGPWLLVVAGVLAIATLAMVVIVLRG